MDRSFKEGPCKACNGYGVIRYYVSAKTPPTGLGLIKEMARLVGRDITNLFWDYDGDDTTTFSDVIVGTLMFCGVVFTLIGFLEPAMPKWLRVIAVVAMVPFGLYVCRWIKWWIDSLMERASK
jgi:hypothetical protein